MNKNIFLIRKTFLSLCGMVLLVFAGISFYKSRHLKEPVVLGPGVTQVKKLSAYFPKIKNGTPFALSSGRVPL